MFESIRARHREVNEIVEVSMKLRKGDADRLKGLTEIYGPDGLLVYNVFMGCAFATIVFISAFLFAKTWALNIESAILMGIISAVFLLESTSTLFAHKYAKYLKPKVK